MCKLYLDNVWEGIGGNLLTDDGSKICFSLAVGRNAVFQDDIRIDSFALDVMWITNNSRFCHRRMLALKKKRVKIRIV